MATEQKQILSLDTLEMVDVPKPEDKKEPANEQKNQEQEEAEEQEEESSEEESEEESGEEGEEEQEDKEEPTNKKDEEESEEEEEEESQSVDEFIKSKFNEEYGIQNEEQFKEVLDRAAELLTENEELREEIETIKKTPAEPVFKSESQKKVYEALKDYDPEKIPDGLHVMAGLVGMDLKNTDPKLILEQEFIMQHPELGLDRARKKFQRRYEEKYTVNEDSFDTKEAYLEKKDDLEIDKDIEVARAKKFIEEKQKEFKVKSENKEEAPAISEEVQGSIAKNAKTFASHLDGLHTLTYQIDENDDKNLFHYKFSKEELEKIKHVVDANLKNPLSYDKKGNMVGGFDPEEKFQQAAHLVCGPKITEEALKFAQKYAQVIKADKIAEKKPSRKAKSSGDLKSMDPMDQFERLAKQKEASRQTVKY